MLGLCHAAAQYGHAYNGQETGQKHLSGENLHTASPPIFLDAFQQKKQENNFVPICHAVDKAVPNAILRRERQILRLCLCDTAQKQNCQGKQKDCKDNRTASRQSMDA